MKKEDARVIKSRRALLDAGLDVLLQKPTATLSEVAAHAGVGRATFYRHFETREALVKALMLECLEATETVVQPIYQQSLAAVKTIEAILRAVVPLANKFHFLLSLWMMVDEDKEITEVYNQQLQALYQLIEVAKSEGSVKPHLTTAWVVSVIDSLLYSSWWMISEGQMTQQQAVDQILETLFFGIRVEGN